MCDAQILTGLGILLSAYTSLSCYISAYHWQLVVYLAWFSNLTHMACLVALRGYLHQNQTERNLRLFFMTILWLGLMVSVTPTAFFNWSASERSPALPSSNTRCFFDLSVPDAMLHIPCAQSGGWMPSCQGTGQQLMPETSAAESAVTSLIILGLSYFTRCIKLLKTLSNKIRYGVRAKLSNFLLSKLTDRRRKNLGSLRSRRLAAIVTETLLIEPLIALYLLGRLYADLLTSGLSDVSHSPLCFLCVSRRDASTGCTSR